jgi:hypothetical protein
MSHTGSKGMEYEIGCQGILMRREGPMVKLYVSEILSAKMCNTEDGMMGEFDDQSVYRRTLGVVCRSQNNRRTILSPPAQESGFQFAYHGTPGVVCRTQNNRSTILSPPAH